MERSKHEMNNVLLVLSPDELRKNRATSHAVVRTTELVGQLPCQVFAICAARGAVPDLFGLLDNLDDALLPLTKEQWKQTQQLPHLHRTPCHSTRSILRQIETHNIDLVVKTAEVTRAPTVMNHIDFRLMRCSPVPVLFVNKRDNDYERVLAAVGHIPAGDQDGFIDHKDYETYVTAREFARAYDASLTAIHVVDEDESSGMPAHDISDKHVVSYHAAKSKLSAAPLAGLHGQQLSNFRISLDLASDELVVRAGKPATVICDYARETDADLAILAAESMSRWDRLVKDTVAESVLCDLHCDLLIAKQNDRRFVDLLGKLKTLQSKSQPVEPDTLIVKPLVNQIFSEPEPEAVAV